MSPISLAMPHLPSSQKLIQVLVDAGACKLCAAHLPLPPHPI